MRALKESPFLRTLLIAVVVIVVLLSGGTYLVRERIKDAMHNQATLTAVAIVDHPLRGLLEPQYLAQPITGPLFEELDAFVIDNLLIHEISLIKLWNPQGTVVYSSMPDQTGKSYPAHTPLLQALRGEIVHEVTHEGEGTMEDGLGDLFEVYIPLSWEPGVVAGAVEVYMPYGPYAAQINSTTKYILYVGALLAVILVAALYAPVRIGWQAVRRERDLAVREGLERKQAEEALRERHERLASLHEVSQAVSGSLDLEAVSSMALQEVINVLGLDAGEIRFIDEATQTDTFLAEWGLPPELASNFRQQMLGRERVGEGLISRVVQSGQPVVVEDIPQRTRHPFIAQSGFQSGAFLPLKVKNKVVGVLSGISRPKRTFTPADIEMMTSLGNMVGMAIANAHLFQQVEATGEELKQTADDLARSNADLQQFASIASHDLQEPLRAVSNYVQLLARRYKGRLDADADEFIGYAVEGTTRMQALIDDLLEYARTGAKGIELEPTEGSHILDLVLDNLKVALRESGAVVTRDTLPTVAVDASQLVQLLQNLISNAIKFRGQEPPRVHVSAEREGNDWVFSVRDNGIGLDPQFADRIFTIFQRLHSGAAYSGTGIGLAICKRIVERHGGRMWVESEPGKGATFRFTIPVEEDGSS